MLATATRTTGTRPELMAEFASQDDPNLPDALWKLRLRGIAAADGLAALARAKAAREAWDAQPTRQELLLTPMRGFLLEYDPNKAPLRFFT